MQLKLQRSQKSSGMISKNVMFCLDARADLSEEEAHNIKKYKLGKQLVYSSEKSRRRLEKAGEGFASETGGGILKGTVALALAKMSLNITVDSLTRGHHIECKSLDELLGAEEAIKEACENVKVYLHVASTFDGREEVVEF